MLVLNSRQFRLDALVHVLLQVDCFSLWRVNFVHFEVPGLLRTLRLFMQVNKTFICVAAAKVHRY